MKRLLLAVAAVLVSGSLAVAEMGDDGLHKAPWMRDTFKDLSEDLADANAEGKRLMVIIEQRGCIYCKKMHETVFPVPKVADYIDENFFVLQINMFGDVVMGMNHEDFEHEFAIVKKKYGVVLDTELPQRDLKRFAIGIRKHIKYM